MAVGDRVQPVKLEDPATGGTQTDPFTTALDPNEDFVDARGSAYQNNTSADDLCKITRDNATDDLTFEDPGIAVRTLKYLARFGLNLITVSPSGNADKLTIQAALDAVTANGTVILVYPGTYLQLLTAPAFDVTILGLASPSGYAILRPPDANITADLLTSSASSTLHLENLQLTASISGGTSRTFNLIKHTGGALRIRRCRINLQDTGGTTGTYRGYSNTGGSLDVDDTEISFVDIAGTPTTGHAMEWTGTGFCRILPGCRISSAGSPSTDFRGFVLNNASAELLLYGGSEILSGIKRTNGKITVRGTPAYSITEGDNSTDVVIQHGPVGKLRETGGPQELLLGAVPDFDLLRRIGTNVVGAGFDDEDNILLNQVFA